MLLIIRNIFIGFIVVMVVACSTVTEPTPKIVLPILNPAPLKIVWRINTYSSGDTGSFAPIINNNQLFIANHLGNIFIIDPRNGVIKKHYHYNMEFSSGISCNVTNMFVTNSAGYLISINKANGTINWQSQLPTIAIETPHISGNIIIVYTNDSQTLAYDATNGSLLWVVRSVVPNITLRIYNNFQILNNQVVLLGLPGGTLKLLNLNTGTEIWSINIATPMGPTVIDKITDVSSIPLNDGQEICVATFNGKLACVDAISNNIIWSKPFSTSYGILIRNQELYAVSQEGVIYAYDKTSGILIWSNNALQYHTLSTPMFLNNNIVIIDSEGYINLFSQDNGKLVARMKSNIVSGISLHVSDGNSVIVQSENGIVAKITQ